MKPEVSIVLPTKEEEGAFGVIAELKKTFGSRAELIVVDKSSEAYRKKIRKLGVVLVPQTTKGVEAGLAEGFAHAHADILATVDADGTHGLEGIKEGMKLVKSGEADLVLGNRMGNLEEGSMNLYLQFGEWGLSWMFTLFYGQRVHDLLTGMQIMNRKSYEKVKDIRQPSDIQIALYQTEIAGLGYKVKEVPIHYYIRRAGESKLAKSKLKYGFQTADRILRRSPHLRSLYVFGILGIILLLLGFLTRELLFTAVGLFSFVLIFIVKI